MSLIKINESELAAALEQWFNDTNTLNKNFWSRNKVGLVIKKNLLKQGKWRNKARGNARKGYKVYLENKAKKEAAAKDDW